MGLVGAVIQYFRGLFSGYALALFRSIFGRLLSASHRLPSLYGDAALTCVLLDALSAAHPTALMPLSKLFQLLDQAVDVPLCV